MPDGQVPDWLVSALKKALNAALTQGAGAALACVSRPAAPLVGLALFGGARVGAGLAHYYNESNRMAEILGVLAQMGISSAAGCISTRAWKIIKIVAVALLIRLLGKWAWGPCWALWPVARALAYYCRSKGDEPAAEFYDSLADIFRSVATRGIADRLGWLKAAFAGDRGDAVFCKCEKVACPGGNEAAALAVAVLKGEAPAVEVCGVCGKLKCKFLEESVSLLLNKVLDALED